VWEHYLAKQRRGGLEVWRSSITQVFTDFFQFEDRADQPLETAFEMLGEITPLLLRTTRTPIFKDECSSRKQQGQNNKDTHS